MNAVVCGTVNSSTALSANGTLIHSSQGRDLPHLEWVCSTTTPMIISDTPSNTRLSSMTRPTVAAGIPA